MGRRPIKRSLVLLIELHEIDSSIELKSMSEIGPHFIVIGAQRAGTTWLHRVLSQHERLWLTPVKELHYFDKQSIKLGVLSKYERHRARFWSFKRAAIDLRWFCRYWFMPRGDGWYGKLFRRARQRGKITGEITPAYAALSEKKWDQIYSLFPEARLIFVMRDPIARTWSALRNNMKKGRIDPSSSVEELIELSLKSSISSRSDYIRAIRMVESRFGSERLHCCFFEELSRQPSAFADSIFRFLGVDPMGEDLVVPAAVNSAAGGDQPPLALQQALAKEYLPMVDDLAERFGNVPREWASRYRALLELG